MGNNEHTLAAMWGANVGRSYNAPFRIEPRRGKVTEDGVESQGNVPCDVLQQYEAGSKVANAVRNPRPDEARVIEPQPQAGVAEPLARIARDEHVHARHLPKVDGAEIAEIRRGVARGQHQRGVLVRLAHPRQRARAEHRLGGEEQAVVAAAQGADRQHATADPLETRYFAAEVIANTTYRDEAIRDALTEGFSTRTIAEAAGLTHAGVAKIGHRAT